MNVAIRNRAIYETHKAHPELTYRELGDTFGISRQEAHRVVKEGERGIMGADMNTTNNHRFDKPISATEVSRETGIPRWTIEKWAQRGLVKVVQHPGHAAPGKPVLLDPVTLNERIRRYRPHRKLAAVEA